MSQDGYTSADALAAVAILGLGVGGLIAGVDAIGMGQRAAGDRISEAVSIRLAADELARLVKDQGPFRSDVTTLEGDPEGFSFPCQAGRCGARIEEGELVLQSRDGQERRIAMPRTEQLRFDYVGSVSTADTWPPPPVPPPAPQWQVVQNITLSDAATDRPVAMARVWVGQAADCEFDSVIKDCREGTR